MDTSTILFAIQTRCLVGVTFQAWRLDNEKRGIALLGVFGSLMHKDGKEIGGRGSLLLSAGYISC